MSGGPTTGSRHYERDHSSTTGPAGFIYSCGMTVERAIEDLWFLAIVEEVEPRRRLATVKYLDDNNIERGVPFDELRVAREYVTDFKASSEVYILKSDSKDSSVRYSIAQAKGSPIVIAADKASASSSTSRGVLPKPLAGLIEDDSEERSKHRPTVTVHSSADTEEAIIINGAENKVAAGGGLRALRYLKH